MPYVQRNPDGSIESLHRHAQPDAGEYLDAADPQIQSFLGWNAPTLNFDQLDASFVRVTEDLIDVLIAKHVIIITDLPPHAQAKLIARKRWREGVAAVTPRLFGESGFADIIDDTGFGKL